MITTLTGENSFSLGQELRRLIAAFTAEHSDLAVERIDAEETDFERLRESLSSLPFLAARKLVVLRAPSKQKIFLETFELLFNDLSDTTEVIIIEPKLDKRLTYYKYLKSKTSFYEFPELDQNGLVNWLSVTANNRAGTIELGAARYLAERVGLNQQLVASELEKLLLYDPKITRATIDLLTDETPQSTIFQLLEAAFAGNAARAHRLYIEQRALKVEPQQIIAMLAWQLHVLSIIKAAGERGADVIASEAKINPFVVRKSQGLARQLSSSDLKKLVNELLNIDIATKTTRTDPDEALQNYLLKLAEN